MRKLLTVLAGVVSALLVAVPASGAVFPFTCEKTISAGQDFDALVNSDSPNTATNFCVNAGTYQVSDPAIIYDGDQISGPVGSIISHGPARYGAPTAKLVGDTTPRVIGGNGSNISIRWLDVSGGDGEYDLDRDPATCGGRNPCPKNGTGVGVQLGPTDGTTVVEYVYTHHNDAPGIAGAHGRIKYNRVAFNGQDPVFLGWSAAGITGHVEYEASYNYIHDNIGNGIYSTNAHSVTGNDPLMASNPGGGFWHRQNVLVNNSRWGLRYEITPYDIAEGEHFPSPSLQACNNRIAGNGSATSYGGASTADAQNAVWCSNTFGQQTIGGVAYSANRSGVALQIHDSGQAHRTDTWNIEARNNTLNGEVITNCDLPDEVALCEGNIP